MTLKADLGTAHDPQLEETSETLGWRAWMLVPLTVIGLTGIVVPITGRGEDSQPATFNPADEEEELVPYYGELQQLLNRMEIPDNQRKSIQDFHNQLTEFADRNKGNIRRTDQERVDRFLRAYR